MAFSEAKLITSNYSAIIKDLEPCEKYLFAVGIVGPIGMGPLNNRPVMIQTNASLAAAPRNVRVFEDLTHNTSMVVEWSPSCPEMGEVSYTVNIFFYKL